MSAARKRRSNKFTAQNTLGQKEVDLEVYFGREQVRPQQVPPVGRALRVPGAHAPRAAAHAFRRVSTALAKATKSSRMRSSSATGLLSSLTASFLRTGRLQLRCRVVSKPPELSTALQQGLTWLAAPAGGPPRHHEEASQNDPSAAQGEAARRSTPPPKSWQRYRHTSKKR